MLAQESSVAAMAGLSEQEAVRRLQTEGYNELPLQRSRGFLHAALEIIREPIFVLLIAGVLVYLALGDVVEGLALLASVAGVIGITLYQERRTERALEALRDLSSPRALVIRDGAQRRIAGREVVRGDLVILAEGDRVPADGVLCSGLNLSVDESLLTGESVPVRKVARAEGAVEAASQTSPRPGGDDQPYIYSGTLVVQGRGVAEVVATGPRSHMGAIGRALQDVHVEKTPLQREIDRIVRFLAVWGFVLCAVLVLGYGLIRGRWLDGLLAGIALAMALLPEEFPVVLTVFQALGAWRLAKQRVLTRRMPTIETLGAATVLCVDKTGTLTQNRMRVRRLFAGGTTFEWRQGRDGPDRSMDQRVPEAFHDLAAYSALASQSEPFDPMEKAILAFVDATLSAGERSPAGWTLVREYPLTSTLLAVTRVWARPKPDDARYVVAAKGAPEAIAELCHLDVAERAELLAHVTAMVQDGLRVLGVARAHHAAAAPLPAQPQAFAFALVGLLGLADPIRPEVPASIQECYGAGIRVEMVTGDSPGTAQAIAGQIGLHDADHYMTGPILEEIDGASLRERAETTTIFARVVPEQKLRLVKAFKDDGEVVAMTGGGVNDAPALKAAHIGIAMGGRGTDVAREAAALVLLDDDFSSIVRAVRMGRRIYDNLRKALSYVLAIHVPIAGMALLPVLFGWPLVLMPLQIVFLEFIIDPASSVVFEAEPEEPDVMHRPPRDPHAPLFTRAMVTRSLLEGTSILLIVLAVFRLALAHGATAAQVRTLTFTTLVLANLALVLATRSRTRTILATLRTPNAALWWVIGGVVAALALVLYVPFLRDLFGFAPLQPTEMLLCLAAALASVLWLEAFKVVRGRWSTALLGE